MSIKSTLVCDGCGNELSGEPGGIPERHALMDLARERGWEWMGRYYEDSCRCPKCTGKAAEEKAAFPAKSEPVPEATTYAFEFGVGQDVVVKALSAPGFVDGVTQDIQGRRYAVVYWLNGKRERDFVYAHEIAARKGKAVEE